MHHTLKYSSYETYIHYTVDAGILKMVAEINSDIQFAISNENDRHNNRSYILGYTREKQQVTANVADVVLSAAGRRH